MSDMNTWMALRSAMQDDGRARRPVGRATRRRVAEFARPHRRTIVMFLVLATVSAVLGVATPLLAGQAVDAIVDGRARGTVVVLAVLIAVVALLDTAVGLLERLTSSRLGEGLILDLRRRVFEHVQSMPIAFFTRTHTGALVSRLNNDVIGAQRAFTSALSGVVTNVIVLVLTLGVMLRLSWPITLLAVVLLPVFVIPARRVGARVGRARAGGGRAQRGHDLADDRAVLGARRDPREAVRPARRRRPRRSGSAPLGCATSACARRWPRRSSSGRSRSCPASRWR